MDSSPLTTAIFPPTTTSSSSPWSSTPTPTYAYSQGSPTDGPERPNDCRLLGPFAILVQLALGALALLSLVYKRWRERPQRPIKIWWFDVSKQVFGSVLVHVANVFMSMLTSGKFSLRVDPMPGGPGGEGGSGDEGVYVPNPCSFYLLNLAIDTTVGIPILIVIVRVLTRLVASTPLGKPAESIQSGNYGNPPNAWWWLKQSFIYFCGLMGMKFCVLILFMMLPWLPHIGDWALRWTEGNEKLQIVFVMMLFPLIMNALQYYIIDSYIKKQEALSADGVAGAGAGDTVVYEELAASASEDSDEEEDEEETRKRLSARKSRSSRDLEYDPAVDGDSQTVIGSNRSGFSGRGALPKELIPPE
ncbi:vacuolar membrane protein-domain-containing protein [Achaetomium macrosporum]|uniref:Vacuolar membrane protein-domain-containing protein n=1 Tax=Achaetomium macrosporum TaxID=79813 RepID=A0AAN7CFB8_9PEZI|nr:vacuolar membrane protein-domain-containing protein [Achaetomium macrosporum]